MNISIVIFCYNERENIVDVIQACLNNLKLLSTSFEIIIVDDGSTDGTSEVIESFARNFNSIQHIKHQTNLGIGMALLAGYAAASKEFVCAVPGDAQFDVNELLKIKPFSFGSFYSFYRPETNYSSYRRLLNFSNRMFNRIFLNIQLRDVNWVKIYRKDQLEFTNMELKSSIVESEICAKLIKAGCLPVEVPSVYHIRKSGKSKGGNWKTLSKAIGEMFSLYLFVRRFKKKI